MRPRLTLRYRTPQHPLQVVHVVMLERPQRCASQPCPHADRRVVVRVRNDEASLAREGGNVRRVGRKAHRVNDARFLAREPCNECLGLQMQVDGTALSTRGASDEAIAVDSGRDGVSTPTGTLCKAEVVVGRNVEATDVAASRFVSRVVVGGLAFNNLNGATGHAGGRPGEAVVLRMTTVKNCPRMSCNEHLRVGALADGCKTNRSLRAEERSPAMRKVRELIVRLDGGKGGTPELAPSAARLCPRLVK